jgi:hypothetical protein
MSAGSGNQILSLDGSSDPGPPKFDLLDIGWRSRGVNDKENPKARRAFRETYSCFVFASTITRHEHDVYTFRGSTGSL